MTNQVNRIRLMLGTVLLSGVTCAATPELANEWWYGADGRWDDPLCWSGAYIPTAADVIGASNNYGTATAPYVIRVTNGVAAVCSKLYLDSADNRYYCGAPNLEVESGGSLMVGEDAYLNFRSRLHLESGSRFEAKKLFVGLPSKTSPLGALSSGVLVNEGVVRVTNATLRRDGVITNSGEMAIAYLKIGGDSGGGRVVMAGGTMEITKECSVAKDGSDQYASELLVTGGEVRNSGYMRAGYSERDRSGTRVTITGDGTKWINSGTGTANDNGVFVGKYNARASYMTNCWLVVANGARMENACAMIFGKMINAGENHRVEANVVVTNGATFVCRNNLSVADSTTCPESARATAKVLVDDASFFVTNKTGTAVLRLGTAPTENNLCETIGTLELSNGGLVYCDTLQADNGARSVANVLSGTLRAKNAQVDGAGVQTVGCLGETGGEWRLGAGGVNVFSQGLSILAGAALGVEFDTAGNCGFADLTGQALTFAQGSQLKVTLNGFEPALHRTWNVAFAATITGLPKAPKGWRVSAVPGNGGVYLQMESVPPSGLMVLIR